MMKSGTNVLNTLYIQSKRALGHWIAHSNPEAHEKIMFKTQIYFSSRCNILSNIYMIFFNFGLIYQSRTLSLNVTINILPEEFRWIIFRFFCGITACESN